MESLINIHSHKQKEEGRKSIINIYPSQLNEIDASKKYSLGLHPWFINPASYLKELELVEENVQLQNILAVGEAGLDKRCNTPFEIQEKVLIRQIEISEKTGKPLIIHCVKAHNELIQLKKKYNPKSVWIIHGFNSRQAIADQFIKHGFYISFGKALSKDGTNAQLVFKSIPLNRCFLETDDDDISIDEIYRAASILKKISFAGLNNNLTKNFNTVFCNDQF